MQANIDLKPYPAIRKETVPGGEMKFIADLGRNLLSLVHPAKVAKCVSESVGKQVKAVVCGLIVELEQIGMVNCAFDAEGQESTKLLRKRQFKKRLSFMPPQVSFSTENETEFLLGGGQHKFEYVSPINIDGKVKGAIVAGFSKKQNCTESVKGLIDASAQMAAMSINLSSHFESVMDATITSAKEEHRKFTETVLDALPVSLYVIDRNYKIVTWNQHREIGEQGLQRDAVIGREVFDVLNKQSKNKLFDEFERAFKTGKIERIEQRTTDENGLTKHWMVSKVPMFNKATGEVTHVISVGEDITLRVEAIQAGARAEKLAAVGRLAAGIVHEINNPLATISACAEALERRASEGSFEHSSDADDLKEYLGLIRNETFRCKSITNGLLDFSRARNGHSMPINLDDVINSSARLVSHQIGKKGIELKIEITDGLPKVNADEGQLQQAIIALATNAVDAMPEGGTLTFRCRAEKNRVLIEVEDSGIGILPDDLPKIFEPFFTTKELGKGTGLGLAVCYGIIADHGGRLSVRSNVGKGTKFTISLPSHKQ